MNIQGLNGPQDINTLKRLLAQGLITQDDLSGATISGSMGPSTAPVQGTQNAISDLVNPGPQDGSQQPPQQSSQDLAAQGQQFVRNESTGQTMYMGPNGPADIPYSRQLDGQVPQAPQTMPNPSAAFTGPRIMPGAQQGQMRVVGSGQGQVTDLGTEPAKAVPLDYSRPQIDVPGVGRGYYGRDGNAYVSNPDGSMTKVLLGYDAQGSAKLTKQNLENAKTREDIAHTEEQIRASKINTPDFSAQGGAGGSGLTGNDYLQTLDPTRAAQVKALAEGRQQFPAGFALKSPYWQNMLSMVAQYDPTFDATNYNNRAKTRADASTGTMAKSNNAINTVIQHLGNLSDKVDPLDTVSGFPGATMVNSVINAVERSAGSTNITNFDSTKGHVAEELVKAWRGVGGNESDIARSLADLDAAKTHAQLHGVISNLADLLQGKIEANAKQYAQGMGAAADVNKPVFISPEAQATLSRISQRAAGQSVQTGQSGPQSIPPAAIAFLRQNPAARFDFDAKYGQGASAQVLGQ